MSERRTLTVPEAARLLGVSRGVAYEAARVGRLPAVRIGRRILIPRARLEQLLGEDLPVNGHAEGGEPIEEDSGPLRQRARAQVGDGPALKP